MPAYVSVPADLTISHARLYLGIPPICKTRTSDAKKPKSKFKVEEIYALRKAHQLISIILPIGDTQFARISIQELADATDIIAAPGRNRDLIDRQENDETTHPRKRSVIPNQRTHIAPGPRPLIQLHRRYKKVPHIN